MIVFEFLLIHFFLTNIQTFLTTLNRLKLFGYARLYKKYAAGHSSGLNR